MQEHFQRVERMVRSIHQFATHQETLSTSLPSALHGLAYGFRTPDDRLLYAWVHVASNGEEAIIISNAPP